MSKRNCASAFLYSSRIGRGTLTYVSFRDSISGEDGALIPANNEA